MGAWVAHASRPARLAPPIRSSRAYARAARANIRNTRGYAHRVTESDSLDSKDFSPTAANPLAPGVAGFRSFNECRAATISRQNESRAIARVDGLPVTLLDGEVVWPIRGGERNGRRGPMSSEQRVSIERQTAVVHAAVLPASLRALIAEQAAEAERLAIHAELGRAGLL